LAKPSAGRGGEPYPYCSHSCKVWPQERAPVADALWTADLTTGPRGEALTYDERLAEILTRYHRDSVVGRAMRRAEPAVRAAIERTRRHLPNTPAISDGRGEGAEPHAQVATDAVVSR
jgi:hypothetical protein